VERHPRRARGGAHLQAPGPPLLHWLNVD
jgi:hypothetical protein